LGEFQVFEIENAVVASVLLLHTELAPSNLDSVCATACSRISRNLNLHVVFLEAAELVHASSSSVHDTATLQVR